MSDDNTAGAATATATRVAVSSGRQLHGASSSSPGPSGLRRSATVDENIRRRSTYGPSSPAGFASAASDPFDAVEPRVRRSSTFSDYALGDEARDLFNPKPAGVVRADEDAGSGWASVPLAFALLPALGGVLFQNGSAIVTDVMLLGLAAVFLHWSVTQPW